MEIRMIFAGDLVPTEGNVASFLKGDLEQLLGKELLKIWCDGEFRSFNLETPLIDKGTPIKKNGPNISAMEETIKGIAKLRPSVVTLANNHILDYGEDGLNSTTDLLDKYCIKHIGSGKNITLARSPYTAQIGGVKIGIYTCVEHEFSEATDYASGANVYDPLNTFDDIKALSDESDIVITLFHGGKEHYRYPSPELQKICRKFIDKGANIVICQHSHCIGCEEKYNEGTIIYGQGNFIFDRGNSEYRKTSLLVRLLIDRNTKKFNLEYVPIVKYDQCVRLANKDEGKRIIDDFKNRSNQIIEDDFIKNNYSKFCKEKYNEYVSALLGKNKLFLILNKLSKGEFYDRYYSQKAHLKVYDYIKCESHREVLLEALKQRIESK